MPTSPAIPMEDLEDGTTQSHRGWHRTLVEMTEQIEQAFRANGKPKEAAIADATIAVQAIFEGYRGCLLYVPCSKAARTALMHKRIFASFNGKNVGELAVRYELSIQAIYRIIKKQRQMRRSAGQTESGGDE